MADVPLTDAELQAMKDLLEKVTPGPWFADVDRPGPGGAVSRSNTVRTLAWPHREVLASPRVNPAPKQATRVANMDFAANCRTWVPRLLAEIERLREVERDFEAHKEEDQNRGWERHEME